MYARVNASLRELFSTVYRVTVLITSLLLVGGKLTRKFERCHKRYPRKTKRLALEPRALNRTLKDILWVRQWSPRMLRCAISCALCSGFYDTDLTDTGIVAEHSFSWRGKRESDRYVIYISKRRLSSTCETFIFARTLCLFTTDDNFCL